MIIPRPHRMIHINYYFSPLLLAHLHFHDTNLPLNVKPLHSEFTPPQSSPVTPSLHLHFHSEEVSESYSVLLPLCIRSYLLCTQDPGERERERGAQCAILSSPVSDN